MSELYPDRHKPFDIDRFQNPSAHYRGAPLWSWNNSLPEKQVMDQIQYFKDMGLGGYHIHSRVGLGIKYLGPEFMELVRKCINRGKELGLLTWLYDEDRWPSGAAGGLVTKSNPDFRAKHLLWTTTKYGDTVPEDPNPPHQAAAPTRNENGFLVAVYHVIVDEEGRLVTYKRVDEDYKLKEGQKGRIWYAYQEYQRPSPWYNDQTYVDTLNKDAMRKFLETTHEVYYKSVGDEFGKSVPAIFTDEPQFVHKHALEDGTWAQQCYIPWTTDFAQTFQESYGYDLLARLPEVFWQLPSDTPSLARYHFHDHVCERFVSSHPDIIGQWCTEHGINLTGHMMHEETLQTQTEALGEVMRCYRSLNLPGIDILQDRAEYTTAKQAQSVSHQYGRPGVMCEIYGVTNWDFDFSGHKNQGNWLAALGITTRVHHLTWVSMKGEAKRDYPACIGYQSPWYKEYSYVEDYFARINSVLTRGKPVVRIGVIHPIESYWLSFGPWRNTKAERHQRQEDFDNLIRWLLFGMLDFDYVSESMLENLYEDSISKFKVGHAEYDVILVPGLKTIRRSTLEKLVKFHNRGGKVIFAGEIPAYVDVVASDEPQVFSNKCQVVKFAKRDICQALEPYQELAYELKQPYDPATRKYLRYPETLMYQLREDGAYRYLFICNTSKKQARDDAVFAIKGRWNLEILDTMNGSIAKINSSLDGDRTTFTWSFPPDGSLLLRLSQTSPSTSLFSSKAISMVDTLVPSQPLSMVDIGRTDLPNPSSFQLEEPNLLLLDTAEYKLDNGPWESKEELLRIDKYLRTRLGWRQAGDQAAQPWALEKIIPEHTLHLRFEILSEVDVEDPELGVEDSDNVSLLFDDKAVTVQKTGHFTDIDIHKVKLPSFTKGRHTITVSFPYSDQVPVEYVYLLGRFGVEVLGAKTKLVPFPEEIGYGSLTNARLPFYAGSITYNIALDKLSLPKHVNAKLRIRKFDGPVIRVDLDNVRKGLLGFKPFEIDLGDISKTKILSLTLYGNRFNTFGHLHYDNKVLWCNGRAYRSEGDLWTYTYLLRDFGITSLPELVFQSAKN